MSYKRKTSKYYIHKEIELIMHKIFYIKQLYFIYRKTKFTDGYINICNQLPRTFTVLLPTIFDRIVLELSCLVDDHGDDDLSICNFIEKYKKNTNAYKEKRYVYIDVDSRKKRRLYIDTSSIKDDIDNLEQCIKSNIKINKYLRTLRNKAIAHNDWKINFKKNFKYQELKVKISYEELEQYINDLFKYMNNIYSTLFKIQFAFSNDIDSELEYLDDILNVKKIDMRNILYKNCGRDKDDK